MARFTSSLTTLQARTILAGINSHNIKLCNAEVIEKVANSVVDSVVELFPERFPVADRLSFLAFALSSCGKEGVKRGDLTVLDYLSMLADIKENNEKDLNDFGAFGDLYEILVRCAFMKKLSLVKWSALSVKDINTSDIVSRKYGIVEVGHNGKTLTFGTMFDYMAGNYTSVVYGVFSEDDKKAIYNLVREKQYDKAIEYVCEYSVYWENKYDFLNDMNSLTRGKGITAKECGIQVVYNDGKYNAFLLALENGKFKSLKETLNG